jgi:hypothetical protein
MSKVFLQNQGPAQPVQLITPSGPLQWRAIDIISKLSPAQGNYTFEVVAIQYFTKWIEANPLTKVSSASIKKSSSQTLSAATASPDTLQSTI